MTMKTIQLWMFVAILICSTALTSCKKDEPSPADKVEEQLRQ